MTTVTANPIRLGTSADVVDAVPYLLGFRPEDSLVMISLRGERKRLGLTARVDLPEADHARECARQFVGHLKRDQAQGALLVLYPPAVGPSHPSVGALAEAFRQHLKQASIKLHEMLCVHDDRWWSLLCADADCCPPHGTPVRHDTTSLCAVATTVDGRVVLGSRAEIERTIEPVAGVVRAGVEEALARASAELTHRLRSRNGSGVVAESLECFRAEIKRRLMAHPPGAALAVDDAARLIVSIEDVRVRDELMLWHAAEWGAAARVLFVDLARHAVPPWQAPSLTLLAWFAYVQGEGALANVAILRAKAADPAYTLAQTVDDVIMAGVNPAVLRRALPTPKTESLGDAIAAIG